jgi:group I intron endonuclease
MPYTYNPPGVYKIVNKLTNQCYVGQAKRLTGRLSDHFCQLKKDKHVNPRLQNAFNKYGHSQFNGEFVAIVEDQADRDVLEGALLNSSCLLDEDVYYNIAPFVGSPMRGRNHTKEAKKLMGEKVSNSWNDPTSGYNTPEYSKNLSEAQIKRRLSKPEFRSKIKFLLDNVEMSHKDLAKILRLKKKYIPILIQRYGHMKGAL